MPAIVFETPVRYPYLLRYETQTLLGVITKSVECVDLDEVREIAQNLSLASDPKLYKRLNLEIKTTLIIDEEEKEGQ